MMGSGERSEIRRGQATQQAVWVEWGRGLRTWRSSEGIQTARWPLSGEAGSLGKVEK